MKLRMQTRNRDFIFRYQWFYLELAVWWFWYCLLEGESFARPDLHWPLQRPWRHWTFWRTSSSFLVQVIIIFGTSGYHLLGQKCWWSSFRELNVQSDYGGLSPIHLLDQVIDATLLASQSFCSIVRWQQRKEMINPIRSSHLRTPP